jgi:Replication factor RFC1 C terminal domain
MQSYLPTLRKVLTEPLRQHGKDGIKETIQTMHEYCIGRSVV